MIQSFIIPFVMLNVEFGNVKKKGLAIHEIFLFDWKDIMLNFIQEIKVN